MKKIIICVSSILTISVCTAFAYNVLPYHKEDGNVIIEDVSNHNFKSWDNEVFSQIKEDYKNEISEIARTRSGIEAKKQSIENAEKILNGFIEELYDQQPADDEEYQQKQEQEIYVKEELEKLSKIKDELFPQEEHQNVIEEAKNFKEQLIWERSLYNGASDEISKKVYNILGDTISEAEKLLDDVQSNSEITMKMFDKARAEILDKRIQEEKDAGIKHLSENEI